jgi:hypothetical protein
MYNVLLVLLVGCASEEGIKVYNTDPVATITSHVDGVEVLEGTEITFIGIVDDGNHNTTDLLVQWSTDTQELCPQSTPDADGTTSCRTTLTTADTQLKLQVVDPEGAAVLSSIVISVLETEAPSATILSPRIDESYYADQLISFSAVIHGNRIWMVFFLSQRLQTAMVRLRRICSSVKDNMRSHCV